MPELPEVDLVAFQLNGLVAGRRIVAAKLVREKLAPTSSPAVFAKQLRDSTIRGVTRRGKHIFFDLDNGRTLIVHLRMSGRFMLLDADDADPKFAHAVFYLDGGDRLVFDDQRHFGMMKIVASGELGDAKEIAKLAPEPLSDAFTLEYLLSVLKASKRTLKEVLLDQTKVTGLGNIYAAEAMFLARLRPTLRAASISKPKAARLFEAIVGTLDSAVRLSRDTAADPKTIDGRYSRGGVEAGWLVYDREGEPCVRCTTPVRRIKQAGRSTYFCPACQTR